MDKSFQIVNKEDMFVVISRIWRPIKEGFLGVFRHGGMSFSSASAVTIALIIISLFSIVTINAQRFTQGLEQSVQIAVLVDYDHESAEEEDRIALAIQNIPGVAKVTYSDKENEFQYYMDSFDDEKTKQAFEPFRAKNPMHDAFYVEVEDGSELESIAAKIQEIEGISSVNFGGASATRLISFLGTARFLGAFIAIALSLLAVLLIYNTIKLTIQARADEIQIMRNVGAKNGFIRAPFVVEGIIIGALGSIIPILLTYYGYRYVFNSTGGYLVSNMFSLYPPIPFIVYVCLGLLAVGILVGLLGSFFSVTRYLRWKR